MVATRQDMQSLTAAMTERFPANRPSAVQFELHAILEQFRTALQARGITPPTQFIADGKFHRVDAHGRKGKRGASYRLHLDGVPAGGFENWHDGKGWENWKADVEDTRTPEARARFAAEVEQKMQQRANEARENQASAKGRADWIWYHSEEATPAHPYLVRKRVPPIGLGLYKGTLVLPMCDIHGELHSLQFIKEDGTKNFLKFGRVEGCFFGLGRAGETLYVAEGYATAASIHLATGLGVAVAFNSGNLFHVAQALRQKYPTRPMVICADDDVLNILRDKPLPNVGLLAAYHSARTVSATVAVPQFPECSGSGIDSTRRLRASALRPLAVRTSLDLQARFYRPGVLPPIDCYVTQHAELAAVDKLTWGTIATHLRDVGILADETDFNDLHGPVGLDAVRRCIASASPAPAAEVEELRFDIAI